MRRLTEETRCASTVASLGREAKDAAGCNISEDTCRARRPSDMAACML